MAPVFGMFLFFAALPPITSLPQAVGVLGANGEAAQLEAMTAVTAACRGKYRRELSEREEIKKKLIAIFSAGSTAVKKGVLDVSPCFKAKSFSDLIDKALGDPEPAVVAYGAEVAARLEDPLLAELLLPALEKRAPTCAKPGLTGDALDACVWVTYAPSAVIAKATRDVRQRAGDLAVRMFDSPYPKIREVAVETAAATGLRAFAAGVAKLAAREAKKGGFETANSPDLIARFEQRKKALEKGEK